MGSDAINELAGALAKAQGKIKPAIKSVENTFYKSSFADLPAVMEACRGPLSENGLAIIQLTQYEGDQIWLETILAHSSGQFIGSKYPVRPVKSDPQGLGSALTYARRYALMAMVGIVADDGSDDDANAASGHGNGSAKRLDAPPEKPNPKTAATEWAKQSEDLLLTFKTDAELATWHKKNADTIARVRDHNEAGHKRLIEAIAKRQAQLSPLNA